MIELLRKLCSLNGTSGRENEIREFIINEIKDHCEYSVDALGNIIAKKQGKNRAKVTVAADAHMDEVGFIAVAVNERGFVKVSTVGGIEIPTLLGQRIVFQNGARGVIGVKPVHLCSEEEKSALPKEEALCVDIGAHSRAEALEMISIGETAVFDSAFCEMGELICSKALDDRIGCAVLITLIKSEAEYDFVATFSTQEEVGLRGAKVAAVNSKAQAAVVIEATTASDIPSCSGGDRVCEVGGGAVVSFMDRSTMYDWNLYNAARKIADRNGIKNQTKTKVAGGNNAGAFHLSGGGIKTVAVSIPCRYIHSSSSVASIKDLEAVLDLSRALINSLAAGEI